MTPLVPLSATVPAFPRGSVLLHVGPHKTGTTAIQQSFHQHRADVEAQGVHYTGAQSQPIPQVLALLAKHNPVKQIGAPNNLRPWRRLVREVDRSRADRVVISSEFFADATEEAVEAVVRDLKRERLQVVVTLRPLARILPSQWQQYVKSGMTTGYDDWLDAMFHRSDTTKLSPTFWMRHQHDRLIARWADAVGSERITVIVLDERDHSLVLRRFEDLAGLSAKTLDVPPDAGNRSLTLSEVELIRQFNRQLKKSGLTKELQHQSIRFGAAPYLQLRSPEPDEQRITSPRWALEEAGRLGAIMAANIVDSGVRIIGDPASLGHVPDGGRAEGEELQVSVPPSLGARAAIGVLQASALPEMYVSEAPVPRFVRRPPTRHLLTALGRRLRAALGRR
jgi:hypothetical protein